MSKVAIVRCPSVDEVSKKINEIIELIDKEKILSLFRNKKVLLKPNLVIDHEPEKGATTHPAVVEALIRLGKEHQAEITLGDGPTHGIKGNIVFKKTGMKDLCEKYGVKWFNFNAVKGRKVKIDNAFAMKEANIAEIFFEVDTIINIPVLKSNIVYWLSCALKNMKGFLVGKEKHTPHRMGAVPQCVADINRVLRQDFILMDGLIGMMGDGPTSGKPANAGILLGGFDPVAIDSACADIMGFPKDQIPMLKYAADAGIGSLDYENVGEEIRSLKIEFDKPLIAFQPFVEQSEPMQKANRELFLAGGSKMVIDEEKCNLCLRCIEACPHDALKKEGAKLYLDLNLCEFCMCCMEACSANAIHPEGPIARIDAIRQEYMASGRTSA